MSDPQPVALPAPAPMVFVDHFAVSISAPGVLRLSTLGHVPSAAGGALIPVEGPSLAMSVPDALALANLIRDQVEQAKALAAQSAQPN